VSLKALTERVHSDGAIPPGRNYIVLMCFKIRELNLQALARHWENSAATFKVLPSAADLAAPLSSQSYVKPELIGPQNCHDGKHADGTIKDFRALLDKTQDAMLCVTIYNGTWGFIKHTSHNRMYISDEQLHAMERCIHHSIVFQ